MHENFKSISAKTAVLADSEHVAVTNPVWDHPWSTNAEPTLVETTASARPGWGVFGSERLAHIVVNDHATFGAPYADRGGRAQRDGWRGFNSTRRPSTSTTWVFTTTAIGIRPIRCARAHYEIRSRPSRRSSMT